MSGRAELGRLSSLHCESSVQEMLWAPTILSWWQDRHWIENLSTCECRNVQEIDEEQRCTCSCLWTNGANSDEEYSSCHCVVTMVTMAYTLGAFWLPRSPLWSGPHRVVHHEQELNDGFCTAALPISHCSVSIVNMQQRRVSTVRERRRSCFCFCWISPQGHTSSVQTCLNHECSTCFVEEWHWVKRASWATCCHGHHKHKTTLTIISKRTCYSIHLFPGHEADDSM